MYVALSFVLLSPLSFTLVSQVLGATSCTCRVVLEIISIMKVFLVCLCLWREIFVQRNKFVWLCVCVCVCFVFRVCPGE